MAAVATPVRRPDQQIHCGSGFLHVVAIQANLSMQRMEMERQELTKLPIEQQGMRPSAGAATISVPVLTQSRVLVVVASPPQPQQEKEAEETEQVLDFGSFMSISSPPPPPPPWHTYSASLPRILPPAASLTEPCTPLYQHLNKLID